MSNDSAEIDFLQNGPIITKNLNSLEDSEGKTYECNAIMALCRCGASKNKPFCDGTHTNINFKSNEPKELNHLECKKYFGKNITVFFDSNICAHSAICLKNLPQVFDLSKRPWINADAAELLDLLNTIRACPSGALTYELKEKTPCTKEQTPQKITIIKNGPYHVQGGIKLKYPRETYCLCRCGKSDNKPFCDGAHRTGFNT